MDENRIFIRTAKAERGSANLPTDLKRILSFIDGRSRSSELAKRSPPSLRSKWNELLGKLAEDGYIVETTATECASAPPESTPTATSVPEAVAVKPIGAPALASARAQPKPIAANNTEPDTEAQTNTDKAARAAELKAYFATAKAKAKAEAKQAAEEAARARAELKAATAAAKETLDAEVKAKAEARQKEQEAARARTQLEAAVAAAKVRSEGLAKAKAEAKQRDQDAARARTELEAAIQAAKLKASVETWAKAEPDKAAATEAIPETSSKRAPARNRPDKWRARIGTMHPHEAQRLRDLEMENDALKKLLTDAYVEIETLKISTGLKR